MSELIIAAGPVGSGKSTWAQVWLSNNTRTRRVVESTRTLGQVMEFLRTGKDVCLVVETGADVSVLNFADEPEQRDPDTLITNLREIEKKETP